MVLYIRETVRAVRLLCARMEMYVHYVHGDDPTYELNFLTLPRNQEKNISFYHPHSKIFNVKKVTSSIGLVKISDSYYFVENVFDQDVARWIICRLDFASKMVILNSNVFCTRSKFQRFCHCDGRYIIFVDCDS